MSWSRTLLRVIAWIVLIGPNLPGPPLANLGRPALVSITEPSLLDSILDLLPAPIRHFYPPTPPYVEPLSFTLTSPAAWLCSPSLSSHGHCPPPNRSRLSASKEYSVRSASSLAERSSAVVWLAAPHALFGSKPAALLSRTSSRTKQALSVMRLKVVNPVFDLIMRPKTSTSIRVSAPSTQTWSGTNPAPPRAGHDWKRGRSCTYIHKPSKSSAFPSIFMVGESIRNWMDMVLARLVAVLSFMVNNLEYAQLWVKSFGQHAYDHPDTVFASISGSLPLILDELWAIDFGLGSLASHVLSSPSVIFNYYQGWFAPHLAAGARIVTEILPTLEQVSIFVKTFSSTSRSVVHYVRDTTSSILSLARNVMRDSHLRPPTYFGTSIQLAMAHPFVVLLALLYLSVALVCLSLLVWCIRTPEDRLLAYMRVDRNRIARELAQMVEMYLALERSRRSKWSDNTSRSRGDSYSSDDLSDSDDSGDYNDDLPRSSNSVSKTEELASSSSPVSNAHPAPVGRLEFTSRFLIEWHPSAHIGSEQTNVGINNSEHVPGSRSITSDDRRKEALVLALSCFWTITCSGLRSVVQMYPVAVTCAFHGVVYGNPYIRLQLPNSTSAFFTSLIVRIGPRPRQTLLIEYSRPLKSPALVSHYLLWTGRCEQVLSLVQPYLGYLTRYEVSHLAGQSQLVARTFRSFVYGDPYLRLVTQMSIATFLERLFARFEVRVGRSAKPRLMIEYPRPTEVTRESFQHHFKPASDPNAGTSYPMLRLSLGQRKEVMALVSDCVGVRNAEDDNSLITSAKLFAHCAFRSTILGESSSRIGFLELVTTWYAPLVARLEEYRPELDLIRLTRKVPPRVRPGAEVYRPRALQRDELSSEQRRERLAKQEQTLIEAAHRRKLAALQEPAPPSDAPNKRRRRPRAGRKVKERRERQEQERLALLDSEVEEET